MSQCGDTLHFKTIRHAVHVCIDPNVLHADDSLNHLREPTKHHCECGVKWTTNPVLAEQQQVNGEFIDSVQWSEERDITPRSSRILGEEDKTTNNN